MKTQEFKYMIYGDSALLGELLFLAFKRIDGYNDEFPIDIAGREPHWGERKIRVFPLDKCRFEDVYEIFPKNALRECSIFNLEISYSYQRNGKKGYATKDVYRVELSYEEEKRMLTITFTRLRGLGRTFPRFLVSLLQKKIEEIVYEKRRYRNLVIREIPSPY